MGSTAISPSLARSHAITLALGSLLVGSLRTLASTRYLTTRRSIPTRPERKALPGTGEQPVDHAFFGCHRTPFEPVFATIETFDVELLAGFDPVLLPDLGGQDDLAPFDDTVVFIACKIASCIATSKIGLERRPKARTRCSV
jgi:hypothetical protein